MNFLQMVQILGSNWSLGSEEFGGLTFKAKAVLNSLAKARRWQLALDMILVGYPRVGIQSARMRHR